MGAQQQTQGLSAAEIGTMGEALACRYLESIGYEILDRNWRTRRGEIDIVARIGETTVAIEVKTKRGTRYGAPLEAITYVKARRLRVLLATWLMEHNPTSKRIRVDGIGITLRPVSEPLLEHVEGIS